MHQVMLLFRRRKSNAYTMLNLQIRSRLQYPHVFDQMAGYFSNAAHEQLTANNDILQSKLLTFMQVFKQNTSVAFQANLFYSPYNETNA